MTTLILSIVGHRRMRSRDGKVTGLRHVIVEAHRLLRNCDSASAYAVVLRPTRSTQRTLPPTQTESGDDNETNRTISFPTAGYKLGTCIDVESLPPLFDLGNIRSMAQPSRVTRPMLDVVVTLVEAFDERVELHGWAIVKSTRRSGPTVYGVIDRLEEAGWITGDWESQNPDPNKPRRRLYRLTPTGVVKARELLAERRPEALVRRVPAPGPTAPGHAGGLAL